LRFSAWPGKAAVTASAAPAYHVVDAGRPPARIAGFSWPDGSRAVPPAANTLARRKDHNYVLRKQQLPLDRDNPHHPLLLRRMGRLRLRQQLRLQQQ
jgi:hypothetical protein